MKRFYTSIIIALSFLGTAAAEEGEAKAQVINKKWSLVTGSASYANHYFNNLEYKGSIMGLEAERGSFYRKDDSFSWTTRFSLYTSPYSAVVDMPGLTTDASTTNIALYEFKVDHGSHYHWEPLRNLQLKAGGSISALAGLNMSKPNSINNIISPQLQLQLNMGAAARYTFEFKRFDLCISGGFSVPFMGFALTDGIFQSSLDFISGSSGLLPGDMGHLLFTSFHNYQAYNLDMGAEFRFKNWSCFIASESFYRWWHGNGIQNYRKFDLFKLGVSVDITRHSRKRTSNRYF